LGKLPLFFYSSIFDAVREEFREIIFQEKMSPDPVVNFTNILRATFCQKITKQNFN